LAGLLGAVTVVAARTVPLLVVLTVQVVSPAKVWPWLRFAASLAHRRLNLGSAAVAATPAELQKTAGTIVALPAALLEPLSAPALFFVIVPPVLSRLAPPLLRTAVFYRHLIPVIVGYLRTLFLDAPGVLKRTGSTDDAQAVWDTTHEWGAQRVHEMLHDLSGAHAMRCLLSFDAHRLTDESQLLCGSGFYLKVGQVFATKADVLPPQYPRVLRRAFDECPPASFKAIKRTLERELGAPLATLFASIDPKPLATATIAQVHTATLHDGTRVAVKVQHDGMERVMRSDLTNMLRVALFLERMKFDLNFDQVSVIREYQVQVPLEFDFCRERDLLQRIGADIGVHTKGKVTCPRTVDKLCTRRVLTMEFMDGCSFSSLQRSLDAEHAQLKLPPGAAPAEMAAMVTDLLRCYGHQIFTLGVFHSDPHPGNLIRRPDGTVGLLDFGECKELDDRERLLFARLTIALSQRHPAAALPLLAECGLEIDGATPEFAMVVAYIVFDTRMDMKEAHMSPLDADADDMRAVKLRTLPAELFMIVRVVTLVRGLLALFKCDVSASQVWEPYARDALKRAGIPPPPPPPAPAPATPRASGTTGLASATDEGQEVGGIYERMYRLAEWMQRNDLPHDRKSLTPFAMAGVTTVAEIAAADETRLCAACKKLSAEQRERCVALAKLETAQRAKEAAAKLAAISSNGTVKSVQANGASVAVVKANGGKGLFGRLRAK